MYLRTKVDNTCGLLTHLRITPWKRAHWGIQYTETSNENQTHTHGKLTPYISPCNIREVQCNLPHVWV